MLAYLQRSKHLWCLISKHKATKGYLKHQRYSLHLFKHQRCLLRCKEASNCALRRYRRQDKKAVRANKQEIKAIKAKPFLSCLLSLADACLPCLFTLKGQNWLLSCLLSLRSCLFALKGQNCLLIYACFFPT
jgi:hypothetical protein